MKKVFKLFASCLPVKGAKRFVVCDLQRSELFIIPEGLYSILTECEDLSLEEIKTSFDNQYDTYIDEHFNYLIENELGFFTSEPEKFPKLEIKWEIPELISNIIIEANSDSNHPYDLIFDQLNVVACRFMELRFYEVVDLEVIRSIMILAENSKLRNIAIYLPYNTFIPYQDLDFLLLQFQRIGSIIIHSVPTSVSIISENPIIYYTEDVIINNGSCGQVSSKYFNINMDHYMESQFHNTCLNKKITIDTLGNIKNCPSLPTIFGNINRTKILEVLSQNEFTQLWNINKDQIETCKDCEFRYICTDCRAFRTENNKIYSKPSKCLYDPYTAEWAFEKEPLLSVGTA